MNIDAVAWGQIDYRYRQSRQLQENDEVDDGTVRN